MSIRTQSLLIASLALATVPAGRGPVQAATRQVVNLSGPRVSVVDAARTVVTFEAKGDIRGLLTLHLVRGATEKGAATLGGEWSLVSRYVRDMATGNEDLGPGAEEAGFSDQDRLAFVERGTIHGAVAGGSLGFDADGQLDSLESLRLQVAGGYLEFAGLSGGGSASASGLQDVNNGSGTLVLAAEVK